MRIQRRAKDEHEADKRGYLLAWVSWSSEFDADGCTVKKWWPVGIKRRGKTKGENKDVPMKVKSRHG